MVSALKMFIKVRIEKYFYFILIFQCVWEVLCSFFLSTIYYFLLNAIYFY